jgi:hypothetical protein
MSSKAKPHLLELKKELFDSKKSLKRYQEIRYLSRWQAVTILCYTLESVLAYHCNIDCDDGDGTIVDLVYIRIRSFKYIHSLYFLADILYIFLVLNRTFQYNFINVSSIGACVK